MTYLSLSGSLYSLLSKTFGRLRPPASCMTNLEWKGLGNSWGNNIAWLSRVILPVCFWLGGGELTLAQTDSNSLPKEREILQACATEDVANLPNPYTDLDPADWYYEAAILLYYCGSYRGAIPPELLLDASQSKSDSK